MYHRNGSGGTLVQLDYGYNKVHDRTYERFGASGAAGDALYLRQDASAYQGLHGRDGAEQPDNRDVVRCHRLQYGR